ncbi:type IX secretion system protein PorQ [Flavihumibacter solisilvae]|uniref:Type IX secretion system protein PorQ n=1 Tax=Flavihumibacter solisilvae TaxID=1349421 RepID=A0A0C1IH03_9BACT|nr:type IX secretion system protein PorQ [Flavihumibacter solisilvae]KIC93465.1 hypothetical protein OI18_17035 [Flavihumibacter solisilvae]
MRHFVLLIIPVFTIVLLTCSCDIQAQSAGGNAVYNFLRFPANPLASSLGDENITVISREVTMSYQQPSLLREEMHGQLGAVFTPMFDGVKNLHLAGAFHSKSLATTFAGNIRYFSYGELTQTDAAGNIEGSFKPRDFVIQANASRRYGERIYYGAALKYIQSDYGMYRSGAIAMDIGANYYDSSKRLQVGILMKNMGTQLKSYTGQGSDNLPFDLQAGITKRLARAPIQFSVTVRELHKLVLYEADSTGTFDHIMQHFVFATQFFIADIIEINAGYNHLKRKELGIPNTTNGLTGFAFGTGVILPRLQIRYARNYYSNSKAINQFGFSCTFP